MPEIMKAAKIKVQRGCTVPAEWVVNDGAKSRHPLSGAPRVFKRQVKVNGKAEEKVFLQLKPGAVLDTGKIPKERLARMMDKAHPVGIELDEEIPPDPPKTAIHATEAEARDRVSRVDTTGIGKKTKARASKGAK